MLYVLNGFFSFNILYCVLFNWYTNIEDIWDKTNKPESESAKLKVIYLIFVQLIVSMSILYPVNPSTHH